METLQELFITHKGYAMSKWSVYLEAYDHFFSKYRNTDVVIMEIGISHGGCLQMWRKYFGPRARIIGVDIYDKCKDLKLDAEVYIGSQSDRTFLRKLKSEIPQVDILIDDGGHTMRQQIITFQEMYDHVKENGIYACEDLHTSYWRKFGGGYKRRGTFIELSKHLIDQLNAQHSRQPGLKPNHFTKTAFSMHFYDSLLLIQKREDTLNKEMAYKGEKLFDGYIPKRNKPLELFQSVVDRLCMFLRLKDPFNR